METCPCCGYTMVRCFQHHQLVSFCRHCWQEMPELTTWNAYSRLHRRSLERAFHQSDRQPYVMTSHAH
ncbi:MAG: hypothetical protein ACAF41_03150 [Leptolyngbya sp. BL-A-14]